MNIEQEKEEVANRLDKLEESANSVNQNIPRELLQIIRKVHLKQLDARSKAKVDLKEKDVTAREKHDEGAPLLYREDFPFDGEQAQNLFHEFLRMVCADGEHMQEAGEVVQNSLSDLDLDSCWQAYIHEDEDFFLEFAEKTPQAPRILQFLVQSSLTPSIEVAAQRLKTEREGAGNWRFGYCPICGSFPLIGSLREKEGFRYMTCSFCHTNYPIFRIGCPFCMETDTANLDYFTLEEYPGFRGDVCSGCNRYIKIADFREMDRTHFPLIDDFETLGLDAVARQEGYERPTLSAWGF